MGRGGSLGVPLLALSHLPHNQTFGNCVFLQDCFLRNEIWLFQPIDYIYCLDCLSTKWIWTFWGLFFYPRVRINVATIQNPKIPSLKFRRIMSNNFGQFPYYDDGLTWFRQLLDLGFGTICRASFHSRTVDCKSGCLSTFLQTLSSNYLSRAKNSHLNGVLWKKEGLHFCKTS